jgi:hypothetical protein
VGAFRFGFGAEVLDDDFLDVAVTVLQGADGLQGFDAFGAGFADADEDARGEGDAELAGEADRFESDGGAFVGRAVVDVAGLAQAIAGGF